MIKDSTKSTKMIAWRGGSMEFVKRDSNRGDSLCKPPWYVVKVWGGVWKDHHWYSWIDYQGPPHIFLTKEMAKEHARQMRKQYHCRTKVIPIGPIDEK